MPDKHVGRRGGLLALPVSLAERLATFKIDADTVFSEQRAGRTNPEMLAAAGDDGRIVSPPTAASATSVPIRPGPIVGSWYSALTTRQPAR
ncbi:hypothetical protein FRAAL0829 [Frankia alni ACN14a]|uniref:Uncharacterized protein n=1 Tax=Frankia alni (strain DSM 45986 / CECT 9034 / ACN14a) TaxID=326424 RepID=Q0RSG5_FRAAA|nr:hypothetical protein FRAAL0829 [Frankia alni ACN14a]